MAADRFKSVDYVWSEFENMLSVLTQKISCKSVPVTFCFLSDAQYLCVVHTKALSAEKYSSPDSFTDLASIIPPLPM